MVYSAFLKNRNNKTAYNNKTACVKIWVVWTKYNQKRVDLEFSCRGILFILYTSAKLIFRSSRAIEDNVQTNFTAPLKLLKKQAVNHNFSARALPPFN